MTRRESAGSSGRLSPRRARAAALLAELLKQPAHLGVPVVEQPLHVVGEPVTSTLGEPRTGLDLLGLDEDEFVARLTGDDREKPPNYEAVIDISPESKRRRRRGDRAGDGTESVFGVSASQH